jgi:hypothetical protein
MKRMAAYSALAALLAGGVVLAAGLRPNSAERSGCPGKLSCPMTRADVCADKCLLRDVDRPDCPGKIECPLTGELVCADECPLAADQTTDAGLPPCCRDK